MNRAPDPRAVAGCALCQPAGSAVLVQTPLWRLVRADEADFPAFYRVVWQQHVAEFSELSATDRSTCMAVVAEVEALLRRHLQPTKINLASLGNQVPHVHWHVVARFEWDSHFPQAVWAPRQRDTAANKLADVRARLPALEAAFQTRWGASTSEKTVSPAG